MNKNNIHNKNDFIEDFFENINKSFDAMNELLKIEKNNQSSHEKINHHYFDVKMPKVKKIIYSKNKSTRVYFDDGTFSVVKIREGDVFSKELGLVYAIIKRVLGDPEKNGFIDGNNYMAYLNALIKNISVDCK